MGIFDKLINKANAPLAEEFASKTTEAFTTGQFTEEQRATEEIKAKNLAQSRKSVFVHTEDITVDESESWSVPLTTLQQFWRFVHKRQPGLIEQFKNSKR